MKEHKTMQIILASASPRRSEILENLKIPFEKRTSLVDEQAFQMSDPIELVKTLAYEKAKSVLNMNDQQVISIGADTIVVFKQRILGKPKDPSEARIYLELLCGKEHSVFSGIAMIEASSGKAYIQSCETKVRMRAYSEQEMMAYIDTKEPMDKAGAYAIQGLGAVLVDKIDGDYFNVVGLPISKLVEGFEFLGINYFDSYHKEKETI